MWIPELVHTFRCTRVHHNGHVSHSVTKLGMVTTPKFETACVGYQLVELAVMMKNKDFWDGIPHRMANNYGHLVLPSSLCQAVQGNWTWSASY